jgi:hypothetical protein
MLNTFPLAEKTSSKKPLLGLFSSFRLSLHVFHSKRALVGHAPAATALGVGPGEQGGSPETPRDPKATGFSRESQIGQRAT